MISGRSRPTLGDLIDHVVKDALERIDKRTVIPMYDESEVQVYSFPQVHSDTTLGLGGYGGQTVTSAQTCVVDIDGHLFVYFGGHFAYRAVGPEARREVMDGVRRLHVRPKGGGRFERVF